MMGSCLQDLYSLLMSKSHKHKRFEGEVMSQLSDLRAAIAQVGVDLGEAIERINSKIPDAEPDLAADIAALADISAQLDAFGVEDDTDPAPPDPPEPPLPPDAP